MTTYKEFYPTPTTLINKMLSGVMLSRIKSVLEPSAGKGDIVDALVEGRDVESKRFNHSWKDNIKQECIDCIELNPDLQSVLKGKGYRVVYNNFLTFHTYKHYDLIIMNPPFSNGEKHLLKALEMQERGGAIICILNAETIKNPYTNERQHLVNELTKYNASIEYLTNEFTTAERKTDVEIALIKVDIPPVEEESVLVSQLKKAQKLRESKVEECNSLIDSDYIKGIIQQYNFEIDIGLSVIREWKAAKPYLLSDFSNKPMCTLNLTLYQGGDGENLENGYVRMIRKKYWDALFYSNDFTQKFTSNLLDKCRREVNSLIDYDFNAFNIYQIKIDLTNGMIKAMEETILKLFDELSHKHHYYDETSNNVHYYNGWKTNKGWIINKKVIIPHIGLSSAINSRYSSDIYQPAKILSDLEKTLDYLSKERTPPTDFFERIKELQETKQTKNIDFKHFTITAYKKGTCHITFKDDELLKKFNLFGSQKKGWLPPTYGRVNYDDMDDEERAVVDEFEGEESYKQTVINSVYLLGGIQLLT